jgi:hypothetical protein
MQMYNDKRFEWTISSPSVDPTVMNVVMFNDDVIIKVPLGLGNKKHPICAQEITGEVDWIEIPLNGPVTTQTFVESIYKTYQHDDRLAQMGNLIYFGFVHIEGNYVTVQLWDGFGS